MVHLRSKDIDVRFIESPLKIHQRPTKDSEIEDSEIEDSEMEDSEIEHSKNRRIWYGRFWSRRFWSQRFLKILSSFKVNCVVFVPLLSSSILINVILWKGSRSFHSSFPSFISKGQRRQAARKFSSKKGQDKWRSSQLRTLRLLRLLSSAFEQDQIFRLWTTLQEVESQRKLMTFFPCFLRQTL